MRSQMELITLATVIVVSQWTGQAWFAEQEGHTPLAESRISMGKTVADLRHRLQRVEALHAARVVTVNPNGNRVSMDQSMLKDTLREVVDDELVRVSPALNDKPVQPHADTVNFGESAAIGLSRPRRDHL